MPNQPFIKKLLERRIPQILGSYFVAGTSLILFAEYLVEKYQFPSHYPTLALFVLIGILSSVIILSYFHGAPGKDEWTKVEEVGIPIKYLIHFTSLYDDIKMYEEAKILGNMIKGRKLDTLNYLLLDSIRKNIKINLLSEYYNSKKEFTIPTSYEDLEYLNKYSLTIDVFGKK